MTEDEIHRRLKAAIVDHRLPPGTRLAEEALAKAFGVSRTPLRSVLKRLAYERLVVIERNYGASVCRPSAEEAREVFDLRRILEDVMAGHVARQAADGDLAGLRRLVAAERAAIARNDLGRALRIAGDFHLELARLSRNALLLRYLEQLVSLSYVVLALYGRHPDAICSQQDHEALLAAVEAHDPAAARTAMRRHLARMAGDLDYARPAPGPIDFAALLVGSPRDGAGSGAGRPASRRR